MNGEAIITVSAAVVALTSLVKWAGVSGRWGPLIVVILSAIGCGFYLWSTGEYDQSQAFSWFAGWVAVTTSAAGVFGFSQASGTTLTALRKPSDGSNP